MSVTTPAPADPTLVDAIRSQLTKPSVTVSTTIETITPEVAASYLLGNTNNRNLRGDTVAAYARDIREGRWLLSGDSIKFDTTGRLIDGQHRLRAIAEAGAPIVSYVVRGLSPDTRDVVDTGLTRTGPDILSFRQVRNANNVASVARLGVLDEAGSFTTSKDGRNGGGRYRVTHAELLDYVDRHADDLEEFVSENVSYARGVGGAVGAFLYAAYRLHQIDAAAAREFIRSLAEFRTEGPGDPRVAMLNYIRNAIAEGRRVGTGEMLYLVFRTWNAWRTGEQLVKLNTASRSGSIKIPVPVQ